MNPKVEQECDRWAEFRLQQELESYSRRASAQTVPLEKWKEENQATIAEFQEKCRQDWRDRAAEIAAKNEDFCKGVCQGRFHPSNSYSRRLFTAVTGISLPSQADATRKSLREYAGPEIAEYERKRQQEQEAKEAADREKEQARQENILRGIRDRVRLDKSVDGESLVTLAKSLGIEIPIQSIGMIRKRILEVNSSQARYTGSSKLTSMSHFRLYRQCREMMLEACGSASPE